MKTDLDVYKSFFEKNRIPIRLSSQTKSGWPMVISLWYLYRDGKIFCATQSSARILSYLSAEERCGFEIAADLPPYCGIRGQARARIDHDLGNEILDALIIRYLGNNKNELAQRLLKNNENEVAIILSPVRIYSWDFSQRMHQVAPAMSVLSEKVCP